MDIRLRRLMATSKKPRQHPPPDPARSPSFMRELQNGLNLFASDRPVDHHAKRVMRT